MVYGVFKSNATKPTPVNNVFNQKTEGSIKKFFRLKKKRQSIT